MNSNIKSIERRFKRLLKDCEKSRLIIISIGDGDNLSLYDLDDYLEGDLDQISGIKNENGEYVEPIIDLFSRAIH